MWEKIGTWSIHKITHEVKTMVADKAAPMCE